jgi:hypothetical protein
MKNKLLLFIFLLISTAFSQTLHVEKAIFSVDGFNSRWADDKTILNYEPSGKFAGIQKSDGKIYVAVNDTQSTTNLGLLIFTSTDDGESWSAASDGVNYRDYMENVKMIRTIHDSIYCFFQTGDKVYCWNLLSSTEPIRPVFSGGYRSFDVTTSSTGHFYIFVDSLPNNSIVRYTSANGGIDWTTRGLITTAGALPKVSMSGTGDTLLLNYYGPVLSDTASSVLRLVRYRQSAPGTLASAGFIDITTDPAQKHEFVNASNNSEMWFIYTSGNVGARSIWGRKSSNAGVSWEPAFALTNNPNFDYYGIDIKFHSFNNYGFDLVYQADSVQAGAPTNTSDHLFFSESTYGSMEFTGLTHISDYPPAPYSSNYSSGIVTLNNSQDVGVIYVGIDGDNKKLFWDRSLAVIPVELTSFIANVNNSSVLLDWTTATEVNNKGFFVERKSGNDNFTSVAFMQGKGTTTEQQSYSYSDNNLASGKYFYRLKQVDLDGTSTISKTIAVDILQPMEFSLSQNYPNPFNPTTVISYSLPEKSEVTIRIYSTLGEYIGMIEQGTKDAGYYRVDFDGKQLTSGTYIYQLRATSSNNTFTDTKKMLFIK